MSKARRKGKKMTKIKRALISVSDKEGIIDFARGLQELDIDTGRKS